MEFHEIKEYRVADLKEAPYNPRKIEEPELRRLRSSIEEFGFLEPIVVNKRTGHVVSGNQRLGILKENNIEKTPVVEVDWDIEKEKAANIAMNNPAIRGEYTHSVHDLLNEIQEKTPDIYDRLRFFEIPKNLIKKEDKEIIQEATNPVNEEMGLKPFENYDYVVILTTTTQDWHWLTEFLGIEKVNYEVMGKSNQIGLGRGIPFKKFYEKMREKGCVK